jgi:hypothetical protein
VHWVVWLSVECDAYRGHLIPRALKVVAQVSVAYFIPPHRKPVPVRVPE